MSLEIKQLKMEEIILLAENPNKMNDVDFSDLIEKIQDKGFDQPIKVWWNDTHKKYEVVKGNHRFQAAQYLDYTEIPAVIAEYKPTAEMDERDIMLADAMSDNIVEGNINPELFTSLWIKLTKKYGKENAMQMMNVSTEDQLKGMIQNIRQQLPEGMQEELDKAKKEIETIEDLARVLNRLFAEYGDTLDKGFMFFDYGGQTHLQIHMEKDVHELTKQLTKWCDENKQNINEYLLPKFKEWAEEIKPEPTE